MTLPAPPGAADARPARPDDPADLSADAAAPGERLAKRVARMVPCSRSEAERYIEAGYVSVDGVVVDVPQFRVLDQAVALSPDASLEPAVPVTLLLHKPAGIDASGDAPEAALALLDAAHRFEGDTTGMRALARHLARQRCLTPLETTAAGLVVFSQDPRVARKLLEDASTIEHESMIEVTGHVTPEALAVVGRPLTVRGRVQPAAKVSISRQSGGVTGLRFAAKGHLPGRIEQACEAAGLRVNAVRRTRIGRVPLSGLPAGQWRYLHESERF
jgi:23S rRNA pseudouridine2604 synthase